MHRAVLLAGILVTTWSLCGADKATLHFGALLPTGPNPHYFNADMKDTCELALRHINEAPDILPNHTLVMHLNDSKCHVGLTIYQLSDLLQSKKEKMVALLGEGCSIVTQPIAHATPLWNLALFNFLSTSPALSNRDIYPHFYPVLPSENGLNPARVGVMKKFEWTKAIILIESVEIFALNAKDLRDEMEAVGIESPEFVLLPENKEYHTIVQFVKDSGIRILFGLFYEQVGREIICECFRDGISAPDYVWNFVGWYQSLTWFLETVNNTSVDCSTEQLQNAVNGHLTYSFAEVRRDRNKILRTNKTVNEIEMALREIRTNSTIENSTADSEVFRQYSAYGYDGVLALGLSLHKIAEDLSAKGEIDRLNNFTYDDDILIKKFHDVTVGDESFIFEGLAGLVQVATVDKPHVKHRHAAGHIEIRYNTKTESNLVAIHENQTLFVQPIRWTTPDGSVPPDSAPKLKKYSSVGIFVVITIFAVIGIIVDIIFLVFNHQAKRHKIMKKTIPRINRWLILGTLGMFLFVILYGFDGQFFAFTDPSSIHICYVRTISLAFGFTFTFGSILVKTIAKLYKLTETLQYLLIGFLALLDIILLIFWVQLDPCTKEQQAIGSDDDGKTVYIREKCSASGGDSSWANGFLIFKLLLMVVTLFVVAVRIKTTKMQKEKHSPYKDLIVTSCGLGFSAAAFGLWFIDNPGAEYGLVSSVFIILAFLILGSMFGIKFLGLLLSKNKSSKPDDTEDIAITEENLRRQEVHELRETNHTQKKLLERVLKECRLQSDLAEELQRCVGKVADIINGTS